MEQAPVPEGDTLEIEAMRKMFVGGLNRNTSEEAFVDHFSQFGTIVDSVIIKDPQSKNSRGFGFITYDRSDCVEQCFAGRPHNLDGKTLDVKRAIPRDENTESAHQRTKKLFVGGVSPDLTPEELRAYIEERHPTSYGAVESFDFFKDSNTGKNKGFGFLMVSSEDFADRLIIAENKFFLNGKQMSLKKAEPKGGEGGSGGRGGKRPGGPMRRFGGPGGGGGSGGYQGNGYGGGYDQGGYGPGGGGGYGGGQYSTAYPGQNYGGGYDYSGGYAAGGGGGYDQSGFNSGGGGGGSNYGAGGNYNAGGRGGRGGGANRYAPY